MFAIDNLQHWRGFRDENDWKDRPMLEFYWLTE
jgi:hypothetical protein